MSGKGECKRALQERLCLEQRWDVPMVGMVTRLVGHKGLDLVRMGLEELMNTENMQFVILGSGDKEYEDYFNYMQANIRADFASVTVLYLNLQERFIQVLIYSLCRLLRSHAALHR